ncbi:MAG TPA: YeeE/YedE family protein [Pseudolabrys sp.]|nr:YeeE/YedE family protein [Pseudolabrys sp.]
MQGLASFLCGLVFGAGLMISGMTQPAKVLGFLDIFGRWDPTLAFVMAGALAISSVGYAWARRQGRPVFAAQHLWPNRTDIDRPLVVGSVLFGIGWGLAGLCPGPALENLVSLSPRVIVFVIAMIAGMSAQDVWQRRAPSAIAIENAALANSDG